MPLVALGVRLGAGAVGRGSASCGGWPATRVGAGMPVTAELTVAARRSTAERASVSADFGLVDDRLRLLQLGLDGR